MNLRHCVLLGLGLVPPLVGAVDQPAKDSGPQLLTRSFPPEELTRHLLPLADWHFFPPAADRGSWDVLLQSPLNRDRRQLLVKQAEAITGAPWPALPATLYMDFARDGNRSSFEDPYFARRRNLSILVLAECLEHRGRFLDEIANGLWAIMEETTWALPAHVARQPNDVLPRLDLETVDLFAAETAMTLATTRYLLHAELEKLSPGLNERIRREVMRRVVEPVEASDNFGRASTWLDGHNNWAPWCSSNVLGSALLLMDDPPRLAKFCARLMVVVDRYLDRYPADGGCEEGPAYWGESPGQLLVFLELLHSRTAGWVDVYREPKLRAMGLFIARAHLAGPWFVNFADSDAQLALSAGKVFRFGQRLHSQAMMNLALLSQRGWQADGPVDPALVLNGVHQPLLGSLMELFWIPPYARPVAIAPEGATWLPDLQWLVARETNARATGLILAAKGGRNLGGASHNHNDAGHFIVYLDGQPGIIDLGSENYTGRTFGPERYQLWFTRGLAHNAPVINGAEEMAGPGHEATQAQFTDGNDAVRLGLNLEKTYPADAGVQQLRRTWELRRGDSPAITVQDTFSLLHSPARLSLVFYSARPAVETQPGRIAIECSPRHLLLEFDPAQLHAEIQPVPITDSRLQHSWGKQVYRLTLTFDGREGAGSYAIKFRAETAPPR